jgi:lysyl-tRNA synthetase class 2
MAGIDWQPTTDIRMLEARASLYREIRAFFAGRQVLEVETPLLASAIGTDPALDPVLSQLSSHGSVSNCFLQTSPEFPMKRLLAAGSGPIWQLCKAFRNGEAGSRHNPEFTILEWYRPGFSLAELMTEFDALLAALLGFSPAERVTYSMLFERHLDIDPLKASLAELKSRAKTAFETSFDSDNPDHWLDLLFSHCIEPNLDKPVFIHDYPPSQAALATLTEDAQGRTVAQRFELVAGGMELANGYFELTDAHAQRKRFGKDLARRKAEGLPQYAIDENLLAALAHGMPACAGVAVGVDRLLMLKQGVSDIRDVIAFPVDRA